MLSKDFFQALKDFEVERKIPKEVFTSALENALTAAYKKSYGEAKSAYVKLDEEKHDIKVYSFKTVVEEVVDEEKEISLADAQLIKKSYNVGDKVEKLESPKDFGRIAAQTAKQVVMQKLREAEREQTLSEIAEKEDKIITTIVKRIDGKNVFVELGTKEAIMSEKDQIPGERYIAGQRIKVYIKPLRDDSKSSIVQASRTHVNFVRRLFELEIPEIQNGDVTIESIAREAGYRTKIAVKSTNENLDAIGACVGNKSMRINSIVNELNGEKIDIIEYSDNPEVFIERALSPARVTKVEILEEGVARAIVPDDVLSLAIGKSGQNVRLAVRLTHSKIDVKAESKVQDAVLQKSKPSTIHVDEYKLDDLDIENMFKEEADSNE